MHLLKKKKNNNNNDLKYPWPNFNWFNAAYVRFAVIVLQAFQCVIKPRTVLRVSAIGKYELAVLLSARSTFE
jgi:hypothetical protein